MNNKCINFKVRTKKGIKYFYCTKRKQIITYSDCKNCVYKEYKQYKTLNKRAYKQNKKEKGRFSIIYQDLLTCCECSLKNGMYDDRIKLITHIDKNEVFGGAYRSLSIEYGMVCPLCTYCHKRFHNEKEFRDKFKRQFQFEFEKNHTRDEFIEIFKENYLK